MFMQRLLTGVLAAAMVVSTGCSVLTKSQVKEVNKFAIAAKGYSDMPSAVIAEYSKLRKQKHVLIASETIMPDLAVETIELGISEEVKLKGRGEKVDVALKVLRNYADLLVKLSSDEFTNELQASSESLGKSIDKGITEYNKLNNSALSLFGSTIATAVRAIGGIYIKCEQEKALQKAITSAEPVVKSMFESVEDLLAEFPSKDRLVGLKNVKAGDRYEFFKKDKEEIVKKYRIAVTNFKDKQQPSLPLMIADSIVASDTAETLAINSIKSADTFLAAHEKLAEIIKEKQDLPNMVEEIQSLTDEVNAGLALKKKLDTK